jgi:hypothetical protein
MYQVASGPDFLHPGIAIGLIGAIIAPFAAFGRRSRAAAA